MTDSGAFVDIHCHLVPGLDDGAQSWEQSLLMAGMAATDGIQTIVVTPHQLGNFAHNSGQAIRARAAELQQFLNHHQIALRVLPGADVRIEPGMLEKLRSGDVLTLADRGKHVLLELPHELYFPLDELLESLRRAGMVGILSHPERNQGLLKQPRLLPPLVDAGCLMQITCGSLLGTFGAASQQLSEWMLDEGLVHFLATDAHGHKARRPLMKHAFERARQMVGEEIAVDLCCRNPAAVAEGADVAAQRYQTKPRGFLASLFKRRNAA
ncbi:MAG: capsular biosynthesis protein [Candidatus Anammoximicrobium sp.]|nr:capsular biosynthesis protein [Candidatus Anammoximicrobium sp.]